MVQPKPLVLVTGASGFIGSHCILALLGSNKFSVRGTVRSIGSKSTAHLTTHPGLKDATLVEADLLKDAGWDAAVAGCDYVLHVASPFPIGKVPENSLVQPAVEGTERVLRAAAKNKVKRVVLTSSVAAVSGGRADGDVEERTFKEDAWSNPDKQDEYGKSKTLAERKAWALAKELNLDLIVINPSYVLGPVLSDRLDYSSLTMVRRLLNGDMPAVPKLWVTAVDVRDVASAHVAALDLPLPSEVAEERRYILDNGQPLWMPEIAKVLRSTFPGYGVPRFTAPYLLVALFGLWDNDAAAVRPSIGVKVTSYDPSKARALLGGTLRSFETSLKEMGESLAEKGLVTPAKSKAEA